MNCTPSFLSYQQTGSFSKIVLDYINREEILKPFYKFPISIEGIREAIHDRKNFNTNRSLLVTTLEKQYETIEISDAVKHNIESLAKSNTFTVCTAHQPNIFTGPLYFIYKILHTIKTAASLSGQIPGTHFVPVYYMGSEDADLDELGHFFFNGEKHEWKTKQTGAVGRMKVDHALIHLLEQAGGQLSVYPFGNEIMRLMQQCYSIGQSIEQATFLLVNELFAAFGLIILLPDNAELKRSFIPVIERELFDAFSHKMVNDTVSQFPAQYKVQASGRDINMFYLLEDKRERMEYENEEWTVVNSDLKFSKEELLTELHAHPERFSPNVILRPVFQEWLLPNIAFIGGGGEIAYWLQLQKVFETVSVPYPLLMLRNSFMIVDKVEGVLMEKLSIGFSDVFRTELELLNGIVKRNTKVQVTLEKERETLASLYDQIKTVAGNVDTTLMAHTEALKTQSLKRINSLEKKMLRAEKRKFEAEQRHLRKIKSHLFPNNNLQERVENMMPFYAKWGRDFLNIIYKNSLTLEQEFTILSNLE
jgi:bacillithiol synthase